MEATTNKNRFKPSFSASDFFNYLMLLTSLASFAVLFFRDITIRHTTVFLGSSIFYFLAFKRMFSSRFKIGVFIRLTLMFIIIFLGVLATSDNITWEIIYASLNFYGLYVFVSTDNKLTIPQHFYKWSGRIFVIAALLLIALSLSSVAYVREDGRETTHLALGMTNPNLTGLLISGVFNMLLINLKHIRAKLLVIAIMGYLIYLVWLTNARTSFLSMMILIIYVLFYKDRKIPSFILFIMMIAPILFIFIYLGLYYSGFEDFVLLGKDFFSGREDTYVYFLNMLQKPSHYLFGNIGFVAFRNAHNGPLAIFCNVGLIGLVLFYWNFAHHLSFLNTNADSRTSRLAMVCILGVCLQTSAEALMFLGVFPASAFMYFYFLMASCKQNLDYK